MWQKVPGEILDDICFIFITPDESSLQLKQWLHYIFRTAELQLHELLLLKVINHPTLYFQSILCAWTDFILNKHL